MTTIYTVNNKVLKNSANDKWLKKKSVDPYNPLNLPANTVRVRTSDGNVPIKANNTGYETATLVPGTSDVYDVYMSGTSFLGMFHSSTNVVEVLGANASNVTNTRAMFYGCSSLTNIPLFDTSSVTTMNSMLSGCNSLTTLPLFDTSNVTDMTNAFHSCTSIQSGALALYQQVSTQANPPSKHVSTFKNCGSNTQTGAAELAQIPSDWK